jgi:dienelactone hydrolase
MRHLFRRSFAVWMLVLISPLGTSAGAVAEVRQATAETLVPAARAIVTQLSDRRFAEVEALFLPPMQAALPVEKLTSAWDAVVASAGAFRQQGDARVEAKGIYRIAIVTCRFERADVDIQLVFDGDGKIAGLSMRPTANAAAWSPAAYVNTAAFTESEVVVGADGWPLPGTLTVPVGSGPFPAIVLVHGSGPQDRDATFGPNRIFKDLALGLASRGVAVLRYEKRSKQHAARLNGVPRMTVRDEVIDDVVAAAAFLRRSPRIDGARVFVAGHSLGGMLVPRILVNDSAFRGGVVMAGAVRSLEQSIVEQTRYLILADGQLSAEEQQQLFAAEQLAGRVRALTPADVDQRESIGGAPASYWLDLRGTNPPAAAATLPQPLLVLQGERDYQVTMADFARWKAALPATANATFRSYPPLNHLFLVGVGPSLPAEYLIPGHVAESVVTDIAAWVAGQR